MSNRWSLAEDCAMIFAVSFSNKTWGEVAKWLNEVFDKNRTTTAASSRMDNLRGGYVRYEGSVVNEYENRINEIEKCGFIIPQISNRPQNGDKTEIERLKNENEELNRRLSNIEKFLKQKM